MLLRNEQVESGVQALVHQQDWERALIIAKGRDRELFEKTTLQMIQSQKKSGRPQEALRLLNVSECVYFPSLVGPLRELAKETFQKENPECVENLKKVLQILLRSSELNNNLRAELSRLMEVTHLLSLRNFLQTKEEFEMAARVQFSLLRYVGTIPMYKTFFQAGRALQKSNLDKLAFVVLNAFLDMYEAVEEEAPLEISDRDILDLLDIPNLEDLPLPESNFISEDEKNQIRDWLLSTSSKYGTELCLEKTRCAHCGASISTKCLNCPKCLGVLGEMCVLSGEVIGDRPKHECSNCQIPALYEYYEKFKLISTNCPWCDHIYDD